MLPVPCMCMSMGIGTNSSQGASLRDVVSRIKGREDELRRIISGPKKLGIESRRGSPIPVSSFCTYI